MRRVELMWKKACKLIKVKDHASDIPSHIGLQDAFQHPDKSSVKIPENSIKQDGIEKIIIRRNRSVSSH